jgi:hypothetical protein
VSVSRAGRPLDERDRELLLFLAEHRVALETQVQMLLDVSAQTAERRLRALAARGFLARQRIFCGEPACCHIRSRGLAAVGSGLPTPRPKLAYYGHDIGLAWIWLAAKRGSLGPQREVISERRMRSEDGRQRGGPLVPGAAAEYLAGPRARGAFEHSGAPFGVAAGRGGGDRLHYPDLLLLTRAGKRVAVELELSSKGRSRLDGILLGYAADGRVDGVLYLVADDPAGRRIGGSVRDAARRLGISDLVAIARLRVPDSPSRGAGGGFARARDVSRRPAPVELGI